MKSKLILCGFMYLFLLFAIPTTAAQPNIDGAVETGEWDNSEFHRIELNTGIEINFSIIYTDTSIYYLAVIDHSKEVNEIMLDNESPDDPHDYFGIEFDNNNDEAIMGTPFSPDDTIIVNYYENIGADMFMHSFTAFFDEENNGENNVEGKAGSDGQNLIFEIAKPMRTSDRQGYDLNLSPGDTYQIMVAFWDDQPAHSAAVGFNKRVDNNQFLTLIVNSAGSSTVIPEIIGSLVILLCLGTSFYIINNGLNTLLTRLNLLKANT